MAMKDRTKGRGSVGPGERSEPGPTEAPRKARRCRRYTPAEREELLRELEESRETQQTFCARHGVSVSTIILWKRELRGPDACLPRSAAHNPTGRSGPPHSVETRRTAVSAFQRSGMGIGAFARAFGISSVTLRTWLERFTSEGEAGLEPRRRGRPRGSGGGLARVPDSVRDEFARTKQRFPSFGLKRVRDFLRRFNGIEVSTGTVARTLEERGIERELPRKKRRRAARPRRFERSRPGELWQTDITSFVLARPTRTCPTTTTAS
jgi:transposase